MSSKFQLCHSKSKDFDQNFDYRKEIGKMIYLEKCIRPDIPCEEHQAATFVTPQQKRCMGRLFNGQVDI